MPHEQDPNEIGALWEKDGPRGKYFTGTIDGQRVVVFRNGNKRSEKAPDWRVLKSKPREAEPRSVDPLTDESIPF